MSRKVRKVRGGKHTIGKLLGRGASFDEIDRRRAVVEAADREHERRKWTPEGRTE